MKRDNFNAINVVKSFWKGFDIKDSTLNAS